LFHDKAWGYGDPQPDHYFLAPNYRMTELQAAVALAQLDRLEGFVERRQRMADRLSLALEALPGVTPPTTTPGGSHVYWRYTVQVDDHAAEVSLSRLGSKLREAGIAALPRYIQKPAFECQVLRDKVTFGNSRFPFEGLGRPPVEYRPEDFPNVYRALGRMLVLGWNEKIDEGVVDFIAERFRAAVAETRRVAGPAV
jgi:dTDP-4-amino-4,6-dideoxygalactose transaminase